MTSVKEWQSMDIPEAKVDPHRDEGVMKQERGYIIVLTGAGDGNGKTTSALGMAV
jgi:ATP:corrinoid adenosyltransferase